jgi:hypothetical protein
MKYEDQGDYISTENKYGWHSFDDKPAIIYKTNSKSKNQGSLWWYKNNERHREDGPAIIYSDGTQEWYFNDNEITKFVINWANERNIDLNNLSEQDKLILKIEMKMWAK